VSRVLSLNCGIIENYAAIKRTRITRTGQDSVFIVAIYGVLGKDKLLRYKL